ncbi:MAG: MBL fold metallo-hydrolase [Planctomycetota bacterium]|nr:MAG: MBL fold metallo-hydrolase [Planctomycetota bacterium]
MTRTRIAILFAWAGAIAAGAQNFDNVEIKSTKLAEHVYMLAGAGGNMGLFVSDEGALLIDDQFAPLTGKIQAAIAKITDRPLRFLVNTHWHGDHVGGNENFGKAGVLIVAHDNVRRRMSTKQVMKAFNREVPPAPPAALPVITYNDRSTFHFGGETIEVIHVAPAHTDGDSLVYFRNANVLHTGDVFFNGMYPFIDAGSGGHIDGVIAAAERALSLTNDKTRIIPGHGDAATPADLREYISMLKAASANIHALIDAGKSRDEIVAAKPTADLDEKWGGGFMQPDRWVGVVYDGIIEARAAADD